jgi:hypothetical protein
LISGIALYFHVKDLMRSDGNCLRAIVDELLAKAVSRLVLDLLLVGSMRCELPQMDLRTLSLNI